MPDVGRQSRCRGQNIPDVGRHLRCCDQNIPDVGRHLRCRDQNMPDVGRQSRCRGQNMPDVGRHSRDHQLEVAAAHATHDAERRQQQECDAPCLVRLHRGCEIRASIWSRPALRFRTDCPLPRSSVAECWEALASASPPVPPWLTSGTLKYAGRDDDGMALVVCDLCDQPGRESRLATSPVPLPIKESDL